jgi:hypothetical protein
MQRRVFGGRRPPFFKPILRRLGRGPRCRDRRRRWEHFVVLHVVDDLAEMLKTMRTEKLSLPINRTFVLHV